LSTLASTRVRPPRIAEAPVAFECALWETLETASRHIFIGRVLMLHARDELIDIDTWRVRLEHYFPVGRFGASDYVTTRDRFRM
jgi:flavin reductase (DIM6/NTAB) family NADH-FMN oxidoreductase RutF